MTRHSMTIGGDAVAGSATFGVYDPSAGEVFAEAPQCSAAELEAAMSAAAATFREWRRDEGRRRDALRAAGATLSEHAAEVAELLTKEQGKPLPESMREVMSASALLHINANLEIPLEIIEESDHGRIEVRRKPYGVVAAITPWNYPVLIAIGKIAPALLAGNTVVLKPSPFTPLSTLLIGELFRGVLPAGVLNVVSGADELGAWMTEHPAVGKITFTGSVATGKKVAASAARDLKRVTLELGGNDPAIVLDDVDPDKIAKRLFWGAFTNSGQVCTAVKRVYAHERIFPALVGALSDIARQTKMGNGFEPDVKLGPLNNRPQLQRVADLVADAIGNGATVEAGGRPRDGAGYFFEPTILTDVSDQTRIVAEEQFGPALPVLPFTDLDDAIERANATHFGLSASIWTADTARGAALATELECGTTWVNQHIALTPLAPFGGAKSSGIGYENGKWGLESFLQLQTVNVRR